MLGLVQPSACSLPPGAPYNPLRTCSYLYVQEYVVSIAYSNYTTAGIIIIQFDKLVVQ